MQITPPSRQKLSVHADSFLEALKAKCFSGQSPSSCWSKFDAGAGHSMMPPAADATTCTAVMEQHCWLALRATSPCNLLQQNRSQPTEGWRLKAWGQAGSAATTECHAETSMTHTERIRALGDGRCILPSRRQLHAWRHRQTVWNNRKNKLKQDESYLFKQNSGFAPRWGLQQTALCWGTFPFLLAGQSVHSLLSLMEQQNLHFHPQCSSRNSRAAGQLLLSDPQRARVSKTLT